ncbi:TPA: hypothetical protein ACF3XD_004468 [Vibrio parahaemolyticus]|nr:hypothetical protein [Vibrio parahaemolyticus]HCE3689651.1 hypothetical protein [Vibrio parahaemolyticus]HCG7163258.1 hypothetical protein [Vibrio parahaemolyticus]HCG9584258.1 hypothetical protein [Vibrio parahaemolyticus]HCH6204831.1 hypothetical protein [Vibrio parahaemolyticus]
MSKELTVGDLQECIRGLPDDMPMTFGSSKYSKRPLIFYRFKARGEDLLQIELNEIDNDTWEDEDSELHLRITVGHLREELNRFWKPTDRVIFGATLDAIPLFSHKPQVVLSFELDQD